MTDTDVKAVVRHRDGYKCRDCGKTNDEHVAEYGRALDVHRIIPGGEYCVEMCVTLCRACHGKKPKSIDQAYWADEEVAGIQFFYFNLYSPEHRQMYDLFQAEAKRRGMWLGEFMGHVLLEACKNFVTEPPLDFVI